MDAAPLMFSEAEMRGHWPWPMLAAGAFDFIMADPPWHMEMRSELGEGRSPQAHYETMSIEEIAALPVAGLAAPDCRLWLWATTPLLPQQLGVMEAWVFKYSTTAVWAKRTVHWKRAFGTGYGGFRNEHEFILVGTRGAPGEPANKSVRSIVEGRMREHSRKPEEIYALAESMYPAAQRLELFSRTNRAGWSVWGNEAGKFGTAGEEVA